MTAPQQEQQGQQGQQRQNDNGNDHLLPVVPVVPVVPGSMLAYLAYRQHQHRWDQDAVAADLVRKMYPLWSLQDFNDLDRTTPLWLSAVVPEVKTAYLQSQRLTAIYANDVRMASLPDEEPLAMHIPDAQVPDNVVHVNFDRSLIPDVAADPELQPAIDFDEFPTADATVSLTITGNYGIKAQMPGPEDDLMQNARSNSAGAGVRHAMNGGRNAVNNVMRLDRRVIGYARVTDVNPCYYCALLASRGAVYGKGSFTDANNRFTPNPDGPKGLPAGWIPARTHDHCRCSLRPVYAKSQAMDDEAKFYRDQWDANTRKWFWLDNKQQVEHFRKTYQPFDRPEPEIHDVREELQSRVQALSEAGHTRTTPQSMWAQRQLDQLA